MIYYKFLKNQHGRCQKAAEDEVVEPEVDLSAEWDRINAEEEAEKDDSKDDSEVPSEEADEEGEKESEDGGDDEAVEGEEEEDSEEEVVEEEEESEEEDSEEEEEEEPEPEKDEEPEESAADRRVRELEEEAEEKAKKDAEFNQKVENFVDYSDFSASDALMDLKDMPDIAIGEGENKTTLKAFIDEFPELMEVMNIISSVNAKKANESSINQLSRQVGEVSWKTELEAQSPGGLKVIQSKEFDTWIKNQGKNIQTLANSNLISDNAMVIDAFNKQNVKEEKKPVVKKAVKKKAVKKSPAKKNKMKELLGDNLKSKTDATTVPDVSDDSVEALEKEWAKINA